MTDILMLPGMDGTGTLFQPFLSRLNNTIIPHVISYPMETLLDYQDLTQYVLSQLPKDKPFVILAESFSGPIAYKIAANPPNNLRGVIFVATFLTTPRPRLTSLAAKLPWSLLKKLKTPEWLTRHYFLGKGANSQLINLFWQVVSQLPPKLIAHRINQITQLQKPNEPVILPCLYLGGINDMLVPENNVDLFKRQCQNLSLNLIDGPHFLLQARPDKAASIVADFLMTKD